MSKRKHRNRPELPFLAQILIQSIGETSTPCQGVIHQQREKPAMAEWEIRMYQDFGMALELAAQGTPREQINQKIWDAACEEQDTAGIVNHKTMYLCSSCTRQIASNHAGEAQATLSMMTATLTSGSFLLVSNRSTEEAAIVSNIVGEVKEEDLRERLQRTNMVDIRFKQDR